MKKNYKIGVTGGIGSGKSQATAYFKQKGFPVFSCDEINSALLQDENYIKTIHTHFPDCIRDGKIDRGLLAKEIFSSAKKRTLLESLSHPAILKRLFNQLESCSGVCFAEVPLLLENDLMEKFDKILVIMRPLDGRVNSVLERDACTKEDVMQKIAMQYDYDKALKEGAFNNEKVVVVYNDTDIKSLHKKLDDFLTVLS